MMKINDRLHGFRLVKKAEVPEVDSTAYEFFHEKSGARLFFLQNDDDNKVFSISFRTPPTDDTGVAHIVEHSTLCGSRKFPLKEPFVELVKGSLNTFLNAITFPDKTMYPVASRNDKDFQNLMDVYLDAVFYPAMRTTPEILMQEGWHYEIENFAEPLRYSGVVYNEMKGALSSPEDLLEEKIMESLYPDTTYSFNSGGDPAAIPTLDQAAFIRFHQKYYHPSNSYIYLYGDMDLDEKLAFLDTEYLSAFDRIPVPSRIERQQAFSEMKRVTAEYPVGAEENTAEKTFLSLNMITGEAIDEEHVMVMSILDYALLESQAAPLRKALLDAELGRDVSSTFEASVLQPFLSIVVNGSEADRAEKFYRVIEDTLTKLVQDGIDRTLMEAAINSTEFRLREADFGQRPKGLIYDLNVMASWLYDEDPADSLRYEALLQKMKDGLDHGYFEAFIKKCLLDNPHKTLLVMKPSRTMAAEREAAMTAELAEKKAALSTAEIAEIIAATDRLKKRQQSAETPEALETIPLVKLSDIRREADKIILEERQLADTTILYSDVETHGIAYLNLYFDAQTIPQRLLPYAYLFCDFVGAVDTKKHSYMEIANLINLHTGGISSDLLAFAKVNVLDSCQSKFKIKAKALVKKLPELCALLQEILMESVFTDRKRLRELLQQSMASMELNMMRASHRIMAARLSSYTSAVGSYNEQGELSFYGFLRDLTKDMESACDKIIAAFAELQPRIFNQHSLVVGLTLPERDYAAFHKNFVSLQQSFSSQVYAPELYHWEEQPLNEGLLSSSQVQYVGKGANFRKLGHDFTGSMRVLETMLRYDYFWAEIRVQGGAYGAMTQFNRNGNMFFASYRDPNLSETLHVFDGTADYLRHFTASEREMDKYVIGTMSTLDMPLTPQMKGNLAVNCWFKGITQADQQRLRDEVLSTRQPQIQALADTIEDCMKQNILCVFGNEVKLQENKQLFGKLTKIMD